MEKKKLKVEEFEFEGTHWKVRLDEARRTYWSRQEMVANLTLQCSRAVMKRRGVDYVWCPETGEALVPGEFLFRWFEMGRSVEKKQALERIVLAFVGQQSVEAGENAERVVDMGETPAAEPEPEAEQEGYETIDWEAFVYDDGEVKGISLRAMVKAGLYAHMRHAVDALRRSGLNFAEVTAESKTDGAGRPASDYIFDTVEGAIQFAASAQTPMGRRILGLLATHHLAIQRLLNGTDEEAREEAERVRAHREERQRGEGVEGVDYMAAMMASLGLHRRADDERRMLAEKQAQLEREISDTRMLHRMREGEMGAERLALKCNVFSTGGHPHSTALIALALQLGMKGRGMMRQVEVEAGAGQDRTTNPKWVWSADGWVWLRDRIATDFGDDDFKVATEGRTYTVVRKKAAAKSA